MTNTPDLLSWRETYPNSPGYKAEGTSADAAASMKPTAATLRADALRQVASFACGLTADECAECMGESVLSIRPRFSELHAAKLIVDTGQRRRNKSGRFAIVWKAA